MKCLNCGEELTSVYAARSVELSLESVDGKDTWIEKNVFSSAVSCPNCHEELPTEGTDELNIPPEYR